VRGPYIERYILASFKQPDDGTTQGGLIMRTRWIAPCLVLGTKRLAIKTKLLGVAVAVALLGASSPVYAQGAWTFTTTDDPAATPGTTGTFAQGINDRGQVVGYFYDSTGIHGFSKTGSSFTTLNYPDAPLTTFAEGINNKGDVVGRYYPNVAGTVVNKAGGFLYSGGVYTAINDPLATDTLVQGINNKDQIVGFYKNYPPTGAQIFHGFFYSGGQDKLEDSPLPVMLVRSMPS
jgi:hypothetical protein